MDAPICSFISLWLPTAAAAVIIGAALIKGGIAGVEVLAVELILSYSQGITNLTKSKRCPKALDT